MRGIRLELRLHSAFAKAGLAFVMLVACLLLAREILSSFTVGMLTDDRASISLPVLAAASNSYPSSSRLQARLARASEREGEPAQAREHALLAVNLSPYNYSYRLLLATTQEALGDSKAAEQSLRAALALAPNKTEVHWQLANLLLRKGDAQQASREFRSACALNAKLFPTTLNLIWKSSGGSVAALEAVTDNRPDATVTLALFLLKNGNVIEASKVFGQLGPKAQLASAQSREFLDSLISTGALGLARDLWIEIVGEPSSDSRLIWNGGFESDVAKDFGQFNWMLSSSDYAKVRIGAGTARTGSRSLRLDFTGRDTTRLDGEIKQLIIARPNTRYTLECYAKAERLVTPEGPRVVVSSRDSKDWVAASEPVAADQQGWQRLEFQFTTPPTADGAPAALVIAIKRKPKFSYDEPTRGTIFFDDFALAEEPGQLNAQLLH